MGKSFLDLTGLSLFKQKIIAKIPTKTSELENDNGFVREILSDTEPSNLNNGDYWVKYYK